MEICFANMISESEQTEETMTEQFLKVFCKGRNREKVKRFLRGARKTKAADILLLFWIECDCKNKVELSVREIGEELDLSKATIERGLKVLKEFEIIKNGHVIK